MSKNVLIGVVTHEKKDYCFDKFIKSIRNQTFKDFDVLFIDNSESDYHKVIEKEGFKVIKDRQLGTRMDKIVSGRNKIRDEFLNSGCDFLFFLDSDVIMPTNTLEKLMLHKKMIVSGVYLIAVDKDDQCIVLPCLYIYGKNENKDLVRQLTIDEVYEDNFIEIGIAGLGCCLIHKEVLEKISFRNPLNSKTGGEDAAFFVDSKNAGHIAYADTSIKCFHMIYPEDDPRHSFHSFDNQPRPGGISYSFSASYK